MPVCAQTARSTCQFTNMAAGSGAGVVRMNRSVWVLSSAGLVRGMGRAATWIFLPLILFTGYSLSFFQVGSLIAAMIPVSVFSNFFSGYLGDRYGRRKVATIPSFFNSAIMFLIYLNTGSGVPVIMSLWAFGEFFTDMALPAQGAMVGDVSGGETVRAYSMRRTFSNGGFAISPALGGLLAESYGLGIIFLVASVTNLAEGLILLALLRESFHGAKRERSIARDIIRPFRDPLFLRLLVIIAGLTVLADQFGPTLTLYLGAVQRLPYFQMGLVYSINGVMVVVLQPYITRIMSRRGSLTRWLGTGSLIYGAGYVTLLAASLPFFFGAMALITLGEDMVSPSQQALISMSAPADRRAGYFGGYSAVVNASKVVSPLLGTLVLGLGASGPLMLWTGLLILSVLVAAGFLRLRAPGPQQTRDG